MTTNEMETPDLKASVNESKPQKSSRGVAGYLVLLALAIAAGIGIYNGIRARVKADADLKRDTESAAVMTVQTVFPKPDAPSQEIILPGNIQAFTDTPIYARTNGYVKQWHVDIGAHVKRGDLLVEIETPEIDQQLRQACADLETAQANLALAKSTAERWQFLLQTNSVSKQETDEKLGDLNAKKAVADSMQANVRRLEDTQGFQKIYAPFDGVVTARNIDTGALINAGSGTSGRELFHLAAIQKLRVYVSVPEVFSPAARPGASATLTLDEFPGQSFTGTLVRHSNAIDPASRTLLVEVDVDNASGRLFPGAYAMVHLKLPKQIRSVVVPANTLLFRSEGLRVGVVRNDRVDLVPVVIGRDYGQTVEIVSGLGVKDAVVLDPPDSLVSGAQVRIGKPGAGTPAE